MSKNHPVKTSGVGASAGPQAPPGGAGGAGRIIVTGLPVAPGNVGEISGEELEKVAAGGASQQIAY